MAGDSVAHTEESSSHLSHEEKSAKALKLGASPSKQVRRCGLVLSVDLFLLSTSYIFKCDNFSNVLMF